MTISAGAIGANAIGGSIVASVGTVVVKLAGWGALAHWGGLAGKHGGLAG